MLSLSTIVSSVHLPAGWTLPRRSSRCAPSWWDLDGWSQGAFDVRMTEIGSARLYVASDEACGLAVTDLRGGDL